MPRICNNRPLLACALLFGTGILLGKFILGPESYLWLLALALFALILYLLRRPYTALLVLFLALGLLRIQLAYPVLPQQSKECELSGRVASLPNIGENSLTFSLDQATKDGYPIDGMVWLRMPINAAALDLEYGDILHTTASLSLPKGTQHEGGMDMRFYYLSSGFSSEAFAFSGLVIREDGEPDFYGRLLLFREQTTQILISLMGEENGSLAAAMLHGDTARIPTEIIDDFRGSGISHLLSVSGLHVALLTGALLFLIRRLHNGAQLCILFLFLALYSMFTAFSPATVRASIMAFCMLSARVLNRRNDPLTGLAASFFLILIVSPFSLFSVGFQLSFTAVLGILLVYPPIQSLLQKRMPRLLAEALGISLTGQLATLPVTAVYFNSVPLLSILANLLIVPLFALAILPSLAALLVYPVLPVLSQIIGGISDSTLTLMRTVASAATQIGAIRLPSPTLWGGLAYFGVLFLLSPYCFWQFKRRAALAGCAVCLFFWLLPSLLTPANHITVLPVGQGYAAHVRMQGKDMAVGDANGLSGGVLQRYLQYKGIVNPSYTFADEEGVSLAWQAHTIRIEPGMVQADERQFTLADTGQIRFTIDEGSLSCSVYADEGRYDILLEDMRQSIDLEDIWTTEHSLKN